MINQAVTHVGFNEPNISNDGLFDYQIKWYQRDNRIMQIKRPKRRLRLSPRCRLTIAWCGSTYQGLDCSSIKIAHELGLKRREPVLFLSKLRRKFKLFTLV